MKKLVARFGKAVKGVLRRKEVRSRKSASFASDLFAAQPRIVTPDFLFFLAETRVFWVQSNKVLSA